MSSLAGELARLDATAQAELVRRRELTPAELVEAALERIERLDPQLNAVIHRQDEKARAAARSAELPEGPFRGVPLLVKDAVCHTAGDPYHAGCRGIRRAGYRAPSDTELARRFRRAGFVIVGRTNTPEFATSATTEPLAYGPTRNPWDLGRSAGGSSGGSGAAVAAGLAPVAHGNDMGGSIRIPAACCGLVGLKPSRGRTTLGPLLGEYWGPLTHEHVLARSVRDTAAVLDAVAGPMPGDPYSAPPPLRPWREEVGADPGRLRIGVYAPPRTELAGEPLGPEPLEAAARLLQSLGHAVERVDLPPLRDPRLFASFGPLVAVGIARELERWEARLGAKLGPDDLEPTTLVMAESGRAMAGLRYVEALDTFFALAREVCSAWGEGRDALVLPTLAVRPPRIGEAAPGAPDTARALRIVSEMASLTLPFNATGEPALSLPLQQGADGLPVGIQVVARWGREDLLLRLAAQLEQAAPWAARLPPLHA